MFNKKILIAFSLSLSSCSLFQSISDNPLNKYSTPVSLIFLAQDSASKRNSSQLDNKNLLDSYNQLCGTTNAESPSNILKTLKEEALKSKFILKKDQINEAKNLLSSGQFVSDIDSVFDIAKHDIFDLVTGNNPQKLPRQTLSDLLGNETFRFAIIVFAHAHGIDINNDDLIFVKKNMLDTDQINLAGLIERGKSSIEKKYGADTLDKIILGCQEK